MAYYHVVRRTRAYSGVLQPATAGSFDQPGRPPVGRYTSVAFDGVLRLSTAFYRVLPHATTYCGVLRRTLAYYRVLRRTTAYYG
eukprot:12162264-Alexandrium_andersonii.AAC.1